jgi:hypothetical protein
MATSARIGDARSSWETGKISVVNDLASEFGCAVGMTTKEYVATIIHAQRNK